jgi:hypothetical protein
MKGARKSMWKMATEQGGIRSADVTKAHPEIQLSEAARELADMEQRGHFTRGKVAGIRGYVYVPVLTNPPPGAGTWKRVRAAVRTYSKKGRLRKLRYVSVPVKAVRIARAEQLVSSRFECAPIVRVA